MKFTINSQSKRRVALGLALFLATSSVAQAAATSSIGAMAPGNAEVDAIRNISGKLSSPIINTLSMTDGLTRYELDLLESYSLLRGYEGSAQMDPDTIKQLKQVASSAGNRVSMVMQSTQLVEAVNSLKLPAAPVQQQPTSGGNAAFGAPPIPSLGSSLFPFNRPNQPAASQPAKPAAPPPKKLDSIDALSDVPEKEASTYTAKGLPSAAAAQGASKAEEKKPPLVQMSFEHILKYQDTGSEGREIYDTTNNLDAYGNPTKKKYESSHYMTDQILAKFAFNASKAVQITTGFRAYNANGFVGEGGSTYSFDNLVALIQNKHRITYGRFNESFGKYNVDLSDVKGIEYNYQNKDTKDEFTVFSGKTGQFADPEYNQGNAQNVMGFQYKTERLIKNFTTALSYAAGKEIAIASNKKSVFTFGFDGKLGPATTLTGEINRGNSETEGAPSQSISAIFMDISHAFSKNVRSTFHFVNVDSNYASFVKGTTGGTSSSTSGSPDYPYPAGNKGFDFSVESILKENVAKLSAKISRYSQDENGNHDIQKIVLGGDYAWRAFDKQEQKAEVLLSLQMQNNAQTSANGYKSAGTTITGTVNGTYMLAKDMALNLGYTFTRGDDGVNGSETRLATGISRDYHVSERVTVTPGVEYEYKKRNQSAAAGQVVNAPSAIDSRHFEGYLKIAYAVIPQELVTFITFSRSKYDVNQPEIDTSTGYNVDGESRNVSGVALGVAWEPKFLEGLTTKVSFGKDHVNHLDKGVTSDQNVISAGISYSRKVTDQVNATVSYDYTRKKDLSMPEYDELMQKIGAQVDLKVGKNSSIQVSHSSERYYRANDPSNNSSGHTTQIEMVNRW